MGSLKKAIGFLIILHLFCQVQSDHHEEALKKADTPLTLEQFEKHFQAGTPIIDLRHLPQNGIIKGAYWVTENGNVSQLVSFAITPQKEYVVVTDEPKRIQNLEKLVQAGFKNILGYNAFDMMEWRDDLVKAEVKKLEQLEKDISQAFIDVRTKPELLETGIFEGALWVPIHEFAQRIHQVQEFIKRNKDSEIVVHCKMSPRARLAASMMMAKGLGPVTVLNENIDKIRQKLVPFNQEL